jgi:outer membrane murein-binding lipoprotein Lpp
MARSDRENGKVLAAVAIGAAVVGLNFIRNRKTLLPMSDELADMAKQGADNVRRDWSEGVRQANGGAEDLKGKPFWTAAGLALASTLISGCSNEEEQSQQSTSNREAALDSREQPMASGVALGGASGSAAHEAYRERFRLARASAGLIRGTVISGATADCSLSQVRDPATDRVLILRSSDPDGEGSFRYHLGDNMLVGRVEALQSDEASERIFVLSKLKIARGTFAGDQLPAIADLAETLQSLCSHADAPRVTNYVLHEDTEALARLK